MRFGEAGEGNAEQIRSQRGNGSVLIPVHNQTVVDLVAEYHQLVFPGHLDNLLQHILFIHSAGRIIRVDNNNRLRFVGNLRLDVFDVRIPVRLLIADIMNHMSAGKRRAGCPERIVRRRNQDFVPVVQQRLHGQIDQLADTVARVDVLNVQIRELLQLIILHDCFSGGEQSAGIRVPLAVRRILNQIRNDLIRRRKTERSRISDVQLQNFASFLFHPGGLCNHRAPHIIQNIVQFRGFLKSSHNQASLAVFVDND